jgi:hypothetical protein
MRTISYEWFRVGQIMLNKKRIRWEKLLAESVHGMPAQFDQLFASMFAGGTQYKSRNE